MKNNFQNIDRLIADIKSILSKNRCSFSDEEITQLNAVISYLESSKGVDSKVAIDWSLILKSLDLLSKVFTNIDSLKDFF